MWTDLDVPTTGQDSSPTYASNEAWGVAAINWLIAQGYSPGLANSAVTKALAGGVDIEGNKMSVQEWSLWTRSEEHTSEIQSLMRNSYAVFCLKKKQKKTKKTQQSANISV